MSGWVPVTVCSLGTQAASLAAASPVGIAPPVELPAPPPELPPIPGLPAPPPPSPFTAPSWLLFLSHPITKPLTSSATFNRAPMQPGP